MKKTHTTFSRQQKVCPAPNIPLLKTITEKILELCTLELNHNQIISISFVSTKTISEINKAFLGHTGPTDVIAFDYREDINTDNNKKENIIAELIICPDVAKNSANKYGTSFEYEILLYIVHGLLHLSGEDDLTPPKRKKMKQKEKKIMDKLQKEFTFNAVFKK